MIEAGGGVPTAASGEGGRDAGPFRRYVETVAAAAVASYAVGFVLAGWGSRLAMRVLALTSPHALGRVTDDQEIVGVVSFEGTMNLVMFLTLVAPVVGVPYLLARRWLPGSRQARAIGYGALVGLVIGGFVVHPDGIDFTVLTPRWLAVAMFVALPAVAGWAGVHLLERLEAWYHRGERGWLGVVALVPALGTIVIVPLGVAVVLAGGLMWASTRIPEVGPLWSSRAVTVAGRIGLVAVGVAAAVGLGSDVWKILV